MTFKTILAKGVSWYSPDEIMPKKPLKTPRKRISLPTHIDLFEEARLSIQAMKDRKEQRKEKNT